MIIDEFQGFQHFINSVRKEDLSSMDKTDNVTKVVDPATLTQEEYEEWKKTIDPDSMGFDGPIEGEKGDA